MKYPSLNWLKSRYYALVRQIKRFPLSSFIILLTILFGLIILANWLHRPKSVSSPSPEVKKVQTYQIGAVPRVRFEAKINKSGTINLTSQTGGIVSAINVREGQTVYAGQPLLRLATSYQGGNAATIQRQIAAANVEQTKKNYPLQQQLLDERRRLARATDLNTDNLRQITRASFTATENIITKSHDALRSLDDLIATQEKNPSSLGSDLTLTNLKQQRLGLLNSLSATEQALQNNQYSASNAQAPARLSDLTKETALKQLDLEDRGLKLNLEISLLNYRLAQINESTFLPAAPFAGTIDKVHVKLGQTITPGNDLFTLAGKSNNITAEVQVPQEIVNRLNSVEATTLSWDETSLEIFPQHISHEPTAGRFFSITYALPAIYADTLAQGQSIVASLPIGVSQSPVSAPFVPLDSIYQTENEAYLYALQDGRALSLPVTLGLVFGDYVEILSGITTDLAVILDRSVIAGEEVAPF